MSAIASSRPITRKCRRSAGFSLLEALMTLAVLAVLAMAALPAAGEHLERSRLQAAAEALATDLGNARLEAAQSGQTLHLAVAAGPEWCWSVSTATGCECGSPTPCQLHRVSNTDHPGLTLTQANGIDLDPSVSTARTAVAVLESRHGERLQVELSALGRPRLCVAASPSPATWRLPRCGNNQPS